MANVSNKIGNAKTIRDYLSSNLTEDKTLKITIDGVLTDIYNVDVIWDGTNFYLAYTTTNENTEVIIINDLDSVLPIQIVKTSTST